MPIKVRYDGDLSALAQLALATGAVNPAGVVQSRGRGRGGAGRGGGGRGGRGPMAPGQRGTSSAEVRGYYDLLAQEAEQEQLERQNEQLRENFEWKLDITAKKRQNEARRTLSYMDSQEGRDRFNEREREIISQQAMQEILSPSKTPYLKEPDVLNDGLPEEQQNGTLFRHESGAWGTYKIDRASGRRFFSADILFKDTPEGIQQAALMKQQESLMAHMQKKRELRETERIKLMTEQFQPMREAKVVPWGRDIKAGPEGIERLRTREEADEILNNIFGPDPDIEDAAAPDAAQEGLSIPEHDPNEAALNSFMYRTRNIPLTKTEKDLPPIVGKAQAFLAKVKKLQDTGKDISRMITTAQYANKILRAYRESLNANR